MSVVTGICSQWADLMRERIVLFSRSLCKMSVSKRTGEEEGKLIKVYLEHRERHFFAGFETVLLTEKNEQMVLRPTLLLLLVRFP